ncbi:MAG: chemotaxis protein CheW [Bacillota bacterium]
MGTRQFVVFLANKEEFGLDIEKISSIEAMQDIAKIPNSPDYIEGVANLRGKVHTIFNLRRRFNMPFTGFDENAKIIITNTPGLFVGFTVDEVREIVKMEDDNTEPVPKDVSPSIGRFLSGVCRVGSRLVKMLDPEKIFIIS